MIYVAWQRGRWWLHISWLHRAFWHWPTAGIGRNHQHGRRFGGFAVWIGRLRIMGGRADA